MEHTATQDQRQQIVAWLASADARAAARHELRRLGLDVYDPDDLLHDVAVRLLRADLPALERPIAYARRSVQRRALDLLRGERVRLPIAGLDQDAPEPVIERADGGDGPADLVAAAAAEDAIRRALFAAVGRAKAWTVAAALSTLTLRLHRSVQLPAAAPRPDTDEPDKADRWAALWLAGETDVFPDPAAGRTDTPAVRQARSRKLRAVDELLRAVAGPILGAHHG